MKRRVMLFSKFSSIHIAWTNFVDISKSWHTLIRVPNARVADPGKNKKKIPNQITNLQERPGNDPVPMKTGSR